MRRGRPRRSSIAWSALYGMKLLTRATVDTSGLVTASVTVPPTETKTCNRLYPASSMMS